MTQAKEIPCNVVKNSEIIKTKIVNNAGETLGSIKEMIIDKIKGEVRYVVLSFGGMFGLGDKLFALPWKVLKYDEKEQAFVIGVDKERLKVAPGFDKDHWPDMADASWNTSIAEFYASHIEQ